MQQNEGAAHMNKTDRINDLTRAEIEHMRAMAATHRTREERQCLWCERPAPMRSDQKFCSVKCKTAYAMALSRTKYERLLAAKERWEAERQELVKEVAELRARIISQ